MKAVFHSRKAEHFSIFIFTLIWAAVVLGGVAWATDPGITLEITILKEGQAVTDPQDLTFSTGTQVGLKMVLKNNTKFPINTERGFSKLEPHRFLTLIDPAQVHHSVGGQVSSGDAPPPFFLGDKTTIPAETLPAGWTKTVTINNVANLFPVMQNTLGWYTLEAQMPFVRLIWILEDKQLGLLGVENDSRNWNGTIDASPKQIQLVLPSGVRGAYLKVQVLDQSTDPASPLSQVAIRVYENASIEGLTPAQAWAKGPEAAELTGTTNPLGWAVWLKDLCQPESNYTAIAYQNEYKDVSFTQGQDDWALQCDGIIEKTAAFGDEPQPSVPGDLDGDGDVDYDDYTVFRTAYGSCEGDENYLPGADLDENGCVAINDYRILRSLIK